MSMMTPPTSGPIASATPETAAQIPNARPRSTPEKASAMIEIVAGSISAAPAPCAPRAAISSPPLVESAHQSEASVKTTRPKAKMRLRPRQPLAPRLDPTVLRRVGRRERNRRRTRGADPCEVFVDLVLQRNPLGCEQPRLFQLDDHVPRISLGNHTEVDVLGAQPAA